MASRLLTLVLSSAALVYVADAVPPREDEWTEIEGPSAEASVPGYTCGTVMKEACCPFGGECKVLGLYKSDGLGSSCNCKEGFLSTFGKPSKCKRLTM